MNVFNKRFSFLPLVLAITSCGIIGQDEVMVPAYICVPSYTFTTDSLIEGSNYQHFPDMWISDGGIIVGAVGLPSLLPIQKNGPTEVRVDAGIILTGQNTQRTAYPLTTSHIETRDLKPGVIDTIRPVFKYLPNIDVKLVEDYDRIGNNLKINPDGYEPGDTVIKVNDNNALVPGNYSGKVEIAPTHQMIQLITNEFKFNGIGSPVYLEIDFNSNLPLDIGYYYNDPTAGASSAQSVIVTYPTTGWRKLYVDFTNEISAHNRTVGSVSTDFIFYIVAANTTNITPAVYIDNVKLLGLK